MRVEFAHISQFSCLQSYKEYIGQIHSKHSVRSPVHCVVGIDENILERLSIGPRHLGGNILK